MSLVRSGDVVGATSPRTGPSLKEGAMADLRIYTVSVNGNETTMQLSEEDAERLDAKPVEADSPAPAKAVTAPPRNKARSPKGN